MTSPQLPSRPTALRRALSGLGLIVTAGILNACASNVYHAKDTVAELKADKAVTAELKILEEALVKRAQAAPITEAVRDRNIDDAIANYREYVRITPAGPEREQATRRLADMMMQARNERGVNTNTPNFDPADIDPNEQGPNDGWDNHDGPTSLYQDLLRRNPNAENKDWLLYQLGQAQFLDNKPQQAVKTLERLVNEHPESRLAYSAKIHTAELLFSKGQFAEAATAYQGIIDDGDSGDFYVKAVYKKGWALLKTRDHADSLDLFHEVLERKLPEGDITGLDIDTASLTQSDQEMVEESLRANNINFVYLGGPSSINSYLAGREERRYSAALYTRLANFYLERESYSDTAKTLAAYLEKYPNTTLAPQYAAKIISTWEQAGFADRVIEAKSAYVARYAPSSDYWATADQPDQDAIIATAKKHMVDLAQYYHALAQDNQDTTAAKTQYQQAGGWYQRIIAEYPDAADIAATNYLLAETLESAGNYNEAAAEFIKVAWDYPSHDQSADAGYAAVIVVEKSISADDQTERQPLIDISLRFADSFPNHPQTNNVLLRTAQDLMIAEQYEQAIKLAQQVSNSPNSTADLNTTAQTIIGNAYFKQEQWAQAEQAYAQLSTGPTAKQQIKDNYAAAIYKQGEAAREAEDHRAAADHFLRLLAKAPTSQFATTAEYDAAIALVSLKAWTEAIPVLSQFIANNPENELVIPAKRNLATGLLESGDTVRAAPLFEELARSDPDPKIREEATWKAPELFIKNGDTPRAMVAFENAIGRYPEPYSRALETRLKLAEHYKSLGDNYNWQRWLNEIVIADSEAGSSRDDRSRLIAANAALQLAKPHIKAYYAARLNAPLGSSLPAKKDAFDASLSAYERVISYGIAETTTEATHTMGELYIDFSKAIMKSERPTDLDELALEEYDIILEEQALPLEEKGMDILTGNVQRINDDIYDEWLSRSLAALATLEPNIWGKRTRGENYVQVER